MPNVKDFQKLHDYEISEKIYESKTILVLRGRHSVNGNSVVIKTHASEYPSEKDTQKILKEHAFLKEIPESKYIIKNYDLLHVDNRIALVMEDIGGYSLREHLKGNGPMPMDDFFHYAREMAKIVDELHKHNIIHKDINPNNIVLNPETREMRVIDFDIATRLFTEAVAVESPNVQLGTLPYISPEQTGRMNRTIDYRTDFYSLGITFYQMLTGQVPFDHDDPMTMVHCHIAQQPKAPHLVNPNIPEPISSIILKMLAKTAEDRYQSAFGLKSDLDHIYQKTQAGVVLETFTPGQRDISEKFSIPQKLYGREQEIATMMEGFERVTEGEKSVLLVTGQSGIGKSALIQEIHKPIVAERGYFISGKFDQFKQDIPYVSLIQAFQELIRQLLTESEESIQSWKNRLLKALGPNGQVIIEVIPEVELIVGEQPPVAALGAQEAENRFNIVFQNFVGVFTKREHPLVLFLDDLQWADSSSLKLLETLLSDHELEYFFLISAYRSSEVDEGHPLNITLQKIKEAGTTISEIQLTPISQENINQLISETIKRPAEECADLAEVVYKKTNGNPFFVQEFLKSLHAKELLKFDYQQGIWSWDIQSVKTKLEVTSNVVELMANKIQELTPDGQHIVKLAAILGPSFSLLDLSLIAQKNEGEAEKMLKELLNEDLIIQVSERFRFVHDRVRQAAYSLLQDEEREQLHLTYGRICLNSADDKELDDQLFSIVNHLNLGRKGIKAPEEQRKLIELNLRAGQKAKGSTAYEPAAKHLKIATEFINDGYWENYYQSAMNVYTNLVEASYLRGSFDEMETFAEEVKAKAKTDLDRVKAIEIVTQACLAQNKMAEGIENMRQALALLGIKLPQKASKLTVLRGILKTRWLMRGKNSEYLLSMSEMQDPIVLAAGRIVASGASAAYYAKPELFPVLIIKILHLTLQHGNAAFSPSAYATYGLILQRGLGDVNGAYKLGKLSLEVAERLNAQQGRAQLYAVYNAFVRHQKEHIRTTLDGFMEGYQIGMQTGNIEYGVVNTLMYNLYNLLCGRELAWTESEMKKYSDVCKKFRQERHFRNNEVRRQVARNFLGLSPDPKVLSGEGVVEEVILKEIEEAGDKTGMGMFYVFKVWLLYVFGAPKEALEAAKEAEKYLDALAGLYLISQFHSFAALSYLAVYHDLEDKERKEALGKIKGHKKALAKMVKFAPMNHEHRYQLVLAEMARIEEKSDEATAAYDKAIELAKANEFINDAAVAQELAGKYFLSRSMEKMASLYLLDSVFSYQKWGARAKVEQMRNTHQELLGQVQQNLQATTSIIGSTGEVFTQMITSRGTETQSLDVNTIIKSYQALSSEIILDKLLEILMNIALENAGAQRGFLILKRGKDLYIMAEADLNEGDVAVMQNIRIDARVDTKLPISLINYVYRTSESQVLQDATNEGTYTKDPYVQAARPKSVICTPVMSQGKSIGVMYLENNLTTNAFTEDRVEVLTLLSGQAAISLENAMMYETLEEKVRERTAELRTAYDEIEKKNISITDSINYARRIQQAMLPSLHEIESAFDDSFVLFRPRDIVSGDFYWFQQMDTKAIVAAVDCTGHGVPGAFMSITGNNLLRQIVKESKITAPDEILSRLHEGIRSALKQEETENRDGMDMAMIVYDRKTQEVEFAGAKNPLVYIQNGEVTTIKGDKNPIGGMQREEKRVYQKHTLKIEGPTRFYIFSDGFQDQFGGPSGRKFMTKRFRNLLLEIHEKPMAEQVEILNQRILDWMGTDHRQIDDILVMGFAIE